MFSKKNNNFNLSHFRNDFPAALVVWLVALPLCLGIAQGSKPIPKLLPDGTYEVIEGLELMTPFSGIIAGIIGGIIVTLFSGSRFGVSGPAAGLITIVIAAIADIGFQAFLLAVFLSGAIQFLLGLFRLGIVGYFIPKSVIHGMLAGIGITLIIKQIPHALGNDSDFFGDDSFIQNDGQNSFTEILLSIKDLSYNYLHDINSSIVIVFLISMLILLVWELPFVRRNKVLKFFPISLIVVIVGALVNYLFSSIGVSSLKGIESSHLVQLPDALSTNDYSNLLVFPDFTAFGNSDVYVYALLLALVASVETLLSVEATDKLDPDKNISPTNKELKAQGIGNLISGLIGGLPITMVIVRSSANINSNAKTQMSAIYHGVLLVISVFVFPNLLEKIPLASLAAILIVLGFKLVKIKNILKSLKTDWETGLVVIVTIVSLLLTDLLTGVGLGFVLSMFFLLRKNYELAFISHISDKKTVISFSQIVSFLNKGALMQKLQEIPPGSTVKISAKKCHTMSREIQEVIVDFRDITSKRNNIELELIGFEKFDIINYEEEVKDEDQ